MTPQYDQAPRLTLLGAFDLSVGGESVPLPMNGQRVLVFLALHGRSLLRPFVAGSLWLDSSEARAAGSLRSALWRLNSRHRFIKTNGERLELSPDIAVGARALLSLIHI